MSYPFNLKELVYLERGTKIWFMSDNKVVCYYVCAIIIEQSLHSEFEYGHPYNYSIKTTMDYKIRDVDMDGYESKTILLSSVPKWFTSKEELINSL